jgi:hypothetical protein
MLNTIILQLAKAVAFESPSGQTAIKVDKNRSNGSIIKKKTGIQLL